MTIGAPNIGPTTRVAVSCSMVRSLEIGSNCLGKLSRDNGQSRVPEPPERITGRMLLTLGKTFFYDAVVSRGRASTDEVRDGTRPFVLQDEGDEVSDRNRAQVPEEAAGRILTHHDNVVAVDLGIGHPASPNLSKAE